MLWYGLFPGSRETKFIESMKKKSQVKKHKCSQGSDPFERISYMFPLYVMILYIECGTHHSKRICKLLPQTLADRKIIMGHFIWPSWILVSLFENETEAVNSQNGVYRQTALTYMIIPATQIWKWFHTDWYIALAANLLNVPVLFEYPNHPALEHTGPFHNRGMYRSFRDFARSRQHTPKGNWKEINRGLKNNDVFGIKENH